MRAIAVLLLLLSQGPVWGQVAVDLRALDGPAPPRAARPVAPAPAVIPARPAAAPQKPKPDAAVRVAPPALTPLPVTVPPAAPASAMQPVPAVPALPPPVRLVFAEGIAELSPDNAAAVRTLAKAIPSPAGGSISVLAFAAGKPNDPSTARRLSLSRGMAVRAVLIESGIASSQIYVRALGAEAPGKDNQGTGTPPDRVELSVSR